jgi:hypothetical protein
VKNKKVILSLLLLVLGLTAIAQQATTATGGDATGSGGSAAYSVGQIVYTTHTGTTGSVAHDAKKCYIKTNEGEKPEFRLTNNELIMSIFLVLFQFLSAISLIIYLTFHRKLN